MKKLLFVVSLIALMAVGLSAKPRFYAGGSLGIDVVNVHGDVPSTTQTTLVVAPELGYVFNKTWSAGVRFGFGSVSSDGNTVSTVEIFPYARATFASVGIVDFFGEFGLGYAHQSADEVSVSGLVTSLSPGVALNFNKNFSMFATTNLFNYQYWDGLGVAEFSVNKGLNVGVRYTF